MIFFKSCWSIFTNIFTIITDTIAKYFRDYQNFFSLILCLCLWVMFVCACFWCVFLCTCVWCVWCVCVCDVFGVCAISPCRKCVWKLHVESVIHTHTHTHTQTHTHTHTHTHTRQGAKNHSTHYWTRGLYYKTVRIRNLRTP